MGSGFQTVVGPDLSGAPHQLLLVGVVPRAVGKLDPPLPLCPAAVRVCPFLGDLGDMARASGLLGVAAEP